MGNTKIVTGKKVKPKIVMLYIRELCCCQKLLGKKKGMTSKMAKTNARIPQTFRYPSPFLLTTTKKNGNISNMKSNKLPTIKIFILT